MATAIQERTHAPLTEPCGPKQLVKGYRKDTYHEPVKNTTHTSLQVQRALSPDPQDFTVNVFNGSDGKTIPVTVRSTDTIAILQQKVLSLKPDPKQSMSKLQTKGDPIDTLPFPYHLENPTHTALQVLRQRILSLRPDPEPSLNLIFNGKPVLPSQTLSELQVKPGAKFITYDICHGG